MPFDGRLHDQAQSPTPIWSLRLCQVEATERDVHEQDVCSLDQPGRSLFRPDQSPTWLTFEGEVRTEPSSIYIARLRRVAAGTADSTL